jgi:hypothetical protein
VVTPGNTLFSDIAPFRVLPEPTPRI